MNKPAQWLVHSALSAGVALLLVSCGDRPSVHCVLAPPGPSELGPASGLTTPPSNAVVFELKYLAQTGAANDISYRSYWGYGGSNEEAKRNPFLQEVRKRTSQIHVVQTPSLTGREWAAVEYSGKQAQALYFDLNGDGKLTDSERIPPTRVVDKSVEFITPDFLQRQNDKPELLSRLLLRVDFYPGNSEPNCMWSPAALLEGKASFNGKPVRMLLWASGPGREFDHYGSSDYSLTSEEQAAVPAEPYIPRETLSSIINFQDEFYRLTLDGVRSNGLPARAVLVQDTSPRGSLAVKVASSNSIPAEMKWLSLDGVGDSKVYFRLAGSKKKNIPLPVGSYALSRGTLSYGGPKAGDWEVSFSKGPCATIEPSKTQDVTLGQPALTVRAVEERDRYNANTSARTTFKKGAQVYLEPRIVGKSGEIFTRFRKEPEKSRGNSAERPPTVTITAPDGKQLLSKVMEYG